MTNRYHHGNLRRALLDRAVEILHEQGVEDLSLRALARDLEVSHAAPLRHFSTKAELLMAIAAEGVQTLIEATIPARREEAGVARLRATALAYVNWARSNSVYHRVLRNPDVMRFAPDHLNGLLQKFAAQQLADIRAAQNGGWRSREDPAVLLVHFVALTAGSAIVSTDDLYRAPVGKTMTHETLEASLEIFFRD